RQLKTRLNEYKGHIRWNTSARSVITEHTRRLQHKHDFDWDNIKILDEKPYYNKRLLSEMLNIKKQYRSECSDIMWQKMSIYRNNLPERGSICKVDKAESWLNIASKTKLKQKGLDISYETIQTYLKANNMNSTTLLLDLLYI
ncbi:hypothetical protein ALC56_03028, partial [Trachymyrmex septentrionalis]